MATDNDFPPGCGEAYDLYDRAWYYAVRRLTQIAQYGEDAVAIKASHELLEYSKHFTILGAPYIPYDEAPTDLEEPYGDD